MAPSADLSAEEIPLPPSPSKLELNSPFPNGTAESDHQSTTTTSSNESLSKPPRPPNSLFLSQSPAPPTQFRVRKGHTRAHSLAGPVTAPLMSRAHSSPGLDSRGRYVFTGIPGSSVHSQFSLPPRRSSPLRGSLDSFGKDGTLLANSFTTPKPMQEHIEFQPRPWSATTDSVSAHWPSSSPASHISRLHNQRSTSPLRPRSGSPVPVSPAKYNEIFPTTIPLSFSTSSSMPSTPSSLRSRSPSISSLETIPDAPVAEAEALEADRTMKFKATADRTEARRSPSPLGGSWSGAGSRDKRKRWSVCGAEGRQDLDLETIWED